MVTIPLIPFLCSHGRHLHERLYALLALAVTLGAEWDGLGRLDSKELAHFLEESGYKLGALVTMEIGGDPLLIYRCCFFVGHRECLKELSEEICGN